MYYSMVILVFSFTKRPVTLKRAKLVFTNARK